MKVGEDEVGGCVCGEEVMGEDLADEAICACDEDFHFFFLSLVVCVCLSFLSTLGVYVDMRL